MIDVSNWEIDVKRQASGTRAKFWVIEPHDTTRYLFKIPRQNTREHLAEYIASKLGSLLGFNTMKAQIATYNNTIGTIAINFVKQREEFNEGGDLFFRLFEDFDRYDLKYYDFFNIMKVLSEYGVEKEFTVIPIFDAFIGNQDRHCDNWGIISSNSGYKLSPIYDNGSSMGFNLNIERIQKMLIDDRMFKAYCDRGRTLIGLSEKKKPKFIDLLPIVNKFFPAETSNSMEKIDQVNQSLIINVLNDVPDEIMGTIYKEFVLKLLLYKRQWIMNWYEGRSSR